MAITGDPPIDYRNWHGPVTVPSFPFAEQEMLNLLREIQQDLARLVAFEQERREGERQMEALAESLRPGTADLDPVAEAELDWYRDSRGNYWERGSNRPLTQQEIDAVTFSLRREARQAQLR